MSKLSQKRKKWGYESSVPRCATCVNFKPGGFFLLDSLPRHFGPKCKEGGFGVDLVGVCDRWKGKDGSTLG